VKDIGIRELKAHASDVVRRVAEEHATYTITRRGRPVGLLVPHGRPPLGDGADAGRAWDRLLRAADAVAADGRARGSAVRELARSRR
jgi:prevent-host-death family protein